MTTAPTYQDLAARKRAEQLSLIPPEWRFAEIPSVDSAPNALPYIRKCLTPTELALTEETDITILLRKLSSGELSSLELTRAFAKRAALAHQLTTCCTEILFEEAFATAKKLDEYLEKTGKTLGPLHGLPVSIKDLFSVKGVDTSIGAYSPLPHHPPHSVLTMFQVGSASPITQHQLINPWPEPSAASARYST
jgi:amidase